MSASLEVLLEAARYIEQQEQRERLTSTSSSASSLSTSPHSTGRFYPSYVSQHSLAATPPASPLSSDIPRAHIDFISTNGTTILRNGKLFPIAFSIFFSLSVFFVVHFIFYLNNLLFIHFSTYFFFKIIIKFI